VKANSASSAGTATGTTTQALLTCASVEPSSLLGTTKTDAASATVQAMAARLSAAA
jgi:hypothetical protein